MTPTVKGGSYIKKSSSRSNHTCAETIREYFQSEKEFTIQVDASGRGFGAVLKAFKRLTYAEQANIGNERELLTVISGEERFLTNVYTKNFTVESDHKPLESIRL